MEKNHLLFTIMIRNCSVLVISLFTLSSCTTMDNSSQDKIYFAQKKDFQEKLVALAQLEEELNTLETTISNREEAVSARETELIRLFAEVLNQKQILENEQAQRDIDKKAAASRALANAKRHTPKQTSQTTTTPKNNLTVLGGIEYAYLDPPGISFSARVDTGAQTSSLNALDMVEFERDGEPYIKFNVINPDTGKKLELTRRIRGHALIKEHKGEAQRRPIVRIRIKLANIDERINFTLVDRSKFKQQVLIGRNLLRDLAVVDVSKEYTTPKIDPNSK